MKSGNTRFNPLVTCFTPLLIMLWFIPGAVYAQSVEKKMYDPFSDTTNAWATPPGSTLSVSGGALHFESHENSLQATWQKADKPEAGFIVAVSTTHTSGSTKEPYGLCFGGRDYGNQFFFLISADSAFKIGKFEDSKWSSISDWTQSDAMHSGQGASNNLLIKARGTWEFYINGIQVYSMPAAELYGGNVGLVVENIHSVDFDNFLLATDKAGAVDNEFTGKFASIVNDFKTTFANSLGDTLNSLGESKTEREWKVKDPLPEFNEQYFMEYGKSIAYIGINGSYSTRSEAMDAFLRIRDLIFVSRTECVLWDGGEYLDDNGVLEGNNWLPVEALLDQEGPYTQMVVDLQINKLSDSGSNTSWEVRLNIVARDAMKK